MHTPTQSRSSALIAAAGQGRRLGLGPKAFLTLGGRSLVEIVASKLLEVTDEVVVAAPPGQRRHAMRLLPGEVRIIDGGTDRQSTLIRLTDAAEGDLLLFHFVARPFATLELYRAVLAAAQRSGAASACMDPGAPIGMENAGVLRLPGSSPDPRILQTPRALRRDRLVSAEGVVPHGERIDICTSPGMPLIAVPGEECNIKITSPLDWEIAQRIIAPRMGLC